ncbi:hypothetical protein [Shimia biformata]|uniref:hypothetical protein n=1 Tax=Shimia biformata TaxID=1294299 RepID=UPI001951054E|nr:hypothetical protein [Shimia biformata]
MLKADYLGSFGDDTQAEIGAILTARFDRDFDGRHIHRLHSEDFPRRWSWRDS